MSGDIQFSWPERKPNDHDTEVARSLLKQIGYRHHNPYDNHCSGCKEHAEIIAQAIARVRQAENEACAKVANFYHDEHVCSGDSGYRVAGFIATAIRNRLKSQGEPKEKGEWRV